MRRLLGLRNLSIIVVFPSQSSRRSRVAAIVVKKGSGEMNVIVPIDRRAVVRKMRRLP
jgi:hypothetical protein